MSIRFVDDDIKGHDIVGRYLAEKYVSDLKQREEDEKKKKATMKGPKTYTFVQCVVLLCTMAPFVAMGMMLMLMTLFVKWSAAMKALASQL